MGLGVLPAQLHTAELHHQSVPDIVGVLCLVRLHVRQYSQLHQLRVCHVVKPEKVGPGLLQSRAVFLQGVRGHSRKYLSGPVPQTLMQVCVYLVRKREIFLCHRYLRLVPCEFIERVLRGLLGCKVIGMGNVGDSHGLGPVLLPYPVGIGKIDPYRCGRVAVPCKRSGVYHFGRDTFDGLFLETGVHRGIVLEPLGVLAQDGCPF